MRQPIMITYNGKLCGLKELAAQKGLRTPTVWERWIRDGRPDTVTDDMFAPVGERIKRVLTLDGRRMSAREIAATCKCSQGTVSLKVKKHGYNLTSEMMQIRHKMSRHCKAHNPMPVKQGGNVDTGDRSPGWWERLHLGHAGKSGFGCFESSEERSVI